MTSLFGAEERDRTGDVVCDLGCGNGFYTIPLAAMVGAKGRVLAVEIQRQMLAMLKRRAKGKPHSDRIEAILGTVSDPKLPENELDLVLFVDVYHELSHPVSVLRSVRKSLKPGGRVYMLSRQNAGQMAAARMRVDVKTDGSLDLRPSPDLADRPRKRSNRQIQSLLAPMAVDELYLRRDGLREISGKKRTKKPS